MSYLPQTQAKVLVTAPKLKAIHENVDLTAQEIRVIIAECLEDAMQATIIDMKAWIEKAVPKRTGALRESLEDALDESWINHGTQLRMWFGTHMEYVQYVNQMSTAQLRHSNQTVKIRGHIYDLDDPQAQHDFMGLAKMELRKRLNVNLKAALQAQLTSGKYGKFAQQMQVVKA